MRCSRSCEMLVDDQKMTAASLAQDIYGIEHPKANFVHIIRGNPVDVRQGIAIFVEILGRKRFAGGETDA